MREAMIDCLNEKAGLRLSYPLPKISSSRVDRPYKRSCFRSEEHTSELQSLMRISYAVFCLKKKKHWKIAAIPTCVQLYRQAETLHNWQITPLQPGQSSPQLHDYSTIRQMLPTI